MLMRQLWLFALALWLPWSAAADPEKLYGPEIVFEVLRDGKKVGRHITRFTRDENNLTVASTMSLEVALFSIPLYRFRYEAEERWSDGRLQRLRVRVDDDGEAYDVRADPLGDGLRIVGPKGRVDSPATLYPTSHWAAQVLKGDKVLNTLTGRINQVAIAPGRPEAVAVKGGTVRATPYRYTGDLTTTAWYDDRGRWVKLRFQAEDGSTIDYICVTCAGN